MDGKLGVQHGHHSHNGISKPPVHHHHGAGRKAGSGRQSGSGGKAGIKVVYISSPMKLTASAEEFRAIVQELTGRDSNVADHDLVAGAGYYSGGGAPSSSYSSFGRVSSRPTAGAGAVSPMTTMVAAAADAGPIRRAPEYAAAPPPFQSMSFEQTAGSLLYGQEYW